MPCTAAPASARPELRYRVQWLKCGNEGAGTLGAQCVKSGIAGLRTTPVLLRLPPEGDAERARRLRPSRLAQAPFERGELSLEVGFRRQVGVGLADGSDDRLGQLRVGAGGLEFLDRC